MLDKTFTSWFAIQVVVRAESKVARLLQYRGHELFLPTYRIRRQWSDRLKSVDLPLFPGYVFCRLGDVSAGLVLSTLSVIRIVSFGGKPTPISEQEIESLRVVSTVGEKLEPCAYLPIGQRVQIVRGPLSGISGLLTQNRNRHRLIISVDAIMKSVSVEIDANDIRVLEAHAKAS